MKMLLTGGGSAVATSLIWAVVSDIRKAREKKRDDAEAKVEANTEKKIDSALIKLEALAQQISEFHLESRIAADRYTAVQAALTEAKERISGMSAAYSKSIDEVRLAVNSLQVKQEQFQLQLDRMDQRFDRRPPA